MKRFYAILAAAFAFVGCSQDEAVTPNIPIEKPTYYATFADAEDESRTYLDENLKLLWHNDDRISLFATTYNEEYAFVDPTGSNSGAFKAVDKENYVTGNPISTTYAVYPYHASNAISNSELLTIHFPAEQSYAEKSFGRGANTMVAAAESASSKLLPFRNAGGYLMLKFYGENKTVKQIELKGNNEEVLSGAATAEAKYGYLPLITMGSEGGQTITLTCEEAVELGATEAEATLFWLVVPPTTFEQGFTITVTDAEGGAFVQTTSKEVVIERNEIRSMAALSPTFEGTTEEPESPKPANNEIWYTSTDGNIVKPDRSSVFGANIVSNTYENGQGVITFDGPVTKIGDYAFYKCDGLTSITIPDGVTEIGRSAFYNCDGLTNVTIGNGVTTIGDMAFRNCNSLAAFYGKFASEDNSCLIVNGTLVAIAPACGLSTFTIPENITTIGRGAIGEGCERFDRIYIRSSLKLEGHAITTDETPANLEFESISSLLEMCSGRSELDELPFQGHWNLYISGRRISYLEIPNGTKIITEGAFRLCDSITCVDIPDTVESIKFSAFWSCENLTQVYIGKGVKTIGAWAFDAPTGNRTLQVFCYPLTPPTAVYSSHGTSGSFPERGHVIYVHEEAQNAYQSKWSNFNISWFSLEDYLE